MLEAVGLGRDEEDAYLALLRTPAKCCQELAERLDVPPQALAGTLHELQDKGLLHHDPGRGLRVAPPDLALGALLVQRQAQLQQTQTAVARIIEDYRARAVLHDSGEVVEVLTGRHQVADRYLEMQHGAFKEVRAMVTGPVMAVSSQDNHAARASLSAGVRHRVVYDRELLGGQEDSVQLEEWYGLGEQIRVTEEVPMKLTIVDERVAFLPTVAARMEEPSAIVVRASGLFDALTWIFESVWSSAIPYPANGGGGGASTPGGPDEQERRLLSLMLAGGTDTSIAKQLGVSVRTVQRRVGRLSDLVGARTRLQLVWQATRRGWL